MELRNVTAVFCDGTQKCYCSLLWRNSEMLLQSFVMELRKVNAVFCDRTEILLLKSFVTELKNCYCSLLWQNSETIVEVFCGGTQTCYCSLLWRNLEIVVAVLCDGAQNLRVRHLPRWQWNIRGIAALGAQLTPLCFSDVRVTAFLRRYERCGEQIADVGESSQHKTYPKKGRSRHRGSNGRLRADAQCLFLFVFCNKNQPEPFTWSTR